MDDEANLKAQLDSARQQLADAHLQISELQEQLDSTNKELTTTPSSGSYTQAGSAENSTFCSAGYQGLIVVDSNGKITSKICGQP